MENERLIMQAIGKGDKIAFEKLYFHFSKKVLNTALHYTQNIADAEEITQDVFMSIYNNATNFKGQSSVNTWIYRITVNKSLNFLKKKSGFRFFSLSEITKDEAEVAHLGFEIDQKDDLVLIFKEINRLPESQKTAFILSYLEELPRQEVADIMHISLKAVESLLQRAKGNLKIKLEKFFKNRRIE